LTFSADFPAAQIAGQPSRQNLLVHGLKGQVAANVRATAVGQQLLGVLETQWPQPQSRGADRIRRPQFHEVIVPTSEGHISCHPRISIERQ
jgi:hypothetical protein